MSGNDWAFTSEERETLQAIKREREGHSESPFTEKEQNRLDFERWLEQRGVYQRDETDETP